MQGPTLADRLAEGPHADGRSAAHRPPDRVDRATLTGNPIAIAERVAIDSILGTAAFSVSESGVLAYRTGAASPQTQLTWVDRAGREIGKVGAPGAYRNPVLSRDGTRVALEATDVENRTQDLWVLEVARGQQFLLNVPVDKDESASPAITVVLNWAAQLRE